MNYLKEVESRGLNGFQMAEVREGLKTLTTDQVDVYARPEYDHMQMQEIRLGLEHGLSAKEMSVFLDPGINYEAMNHARIKIENANVIDEQAISKLHAKQLKNLFMVLLIVVVIVGGVAIGYFGKKYFMLFNQPIEIKLKDSSVEVDYQSMFNPRDYIVDYSEENEVKLSIDSDVNTSKLGLYKVKYTIDNGIKSISKTLDVKVVDKDAPIITLRETNVSMYRTDTFSCEAYIQSATDNVDGDLSKNVKCSSIDTSKDTQVVTYSVEDSQHNKAEATLNLHLSDKPAPTPDVIYVEVPSGNTSQQGNNGSGQIAPSTSHGTQYFMFSDGYNLDSGYSACIATGSEYGAYSCEPIMGDDGLYKGYKLSY